MDKKSKVMGEILEKLQVNKPVDDNEEVKLAFIIKDSGTREEFPSGMVRDVGGDKPRYNRCLEGPMFQRWCEHLHKGAKKYPDVKVGVANWTLAAGEEELQRFKESALSHMIDWLEGKMDEDHAAGVFFNINGAEFVKEVIRGKVKRDQEADTPGASSV